MKDIIQIGEAILREKAKAVPTKNITSKHIQSIISDMNTALIMQSDGVAIAAPQIGESYRIFTVAPFIFKDPKKHHLIYINPKIIDSSHETEWKHEGCLSCRWKVGEVKRYLNITISAYDEYGHQFTKSAEGLLAHIFQHETDHLDGILFIDKARNLRDMTEDEIRKTINN